MINQTILDVAITSNKPLLLIGKHGIGKSYSINERATKEGKTLNKFICTSDTTPDDLIGSYELNNNSTVYINKPLLQSVIDGSWILIDEINTANSSVLTLLNGLLETEPSQRFLVVKNQIVKPHKNFRLFCTANPSSYAHTQELSDSLLSRFIIMQVEPDYGFFIKKFSTKTTKNDIRAFARGILQANKKLEIYISPRELLNYIDLLNNGVSNNDAMQIILSRFYDMGQDKRSLLNALFEVSIEKADDLQILTSEELEKVTADKVNEVNTKIRDIQDKNEQLEKDANYYKNKAEELEQTHNNNDEKLAELTNKLNAMKSAFNTLTNEQ